MMIKVLSLQIKRNSQIKRATSIFVALVMFVAFLPVDLYALQNSNFLRPVAYSQKPRTPSRLERFLAENPPRETEERRRDTTGRRGEVARILSDTNYGRNLHKILFGLVQTLEDGDFQNLTPENLRYDLEVIMAELRKERLGSFLSVGKPGDRLVNFVTTGTKLFNDEILGYALTTDLLRVKQELLGRIIKRQKAASGIRFDIKPVTTLAVLDTYTVSGVGEQDVSLNAFLVKVNCNLAQELEKWLNGNKTSFDDIERAPHELVDRYKRYEKMYNPSPALKVFFGVSGQISAAGTDTATLMDSFVLSDVEATQTARIASADRKIGEQFSDTGWYDFVQSTFILGKSLYQTRPDFFQRPMVLNSELAYYLRLWGYEGAGNLTSFIERHQLSGWWDTRNEKDLRKALGYLTKVNFLDYVPSWMPYESKAQKRAQKVLYAITGLQAALDNIPRGLTEDEMRMLILPLRVAADLVMRDSRNESQTSFFEFNRRATDELARGRVVTYVLMDHEKVAMRNLEKMQDAFADIAQKSLQGPEPIPGEALRKVLSKCAHITDDVTRMLRKNERRLRAVVEKYRKAAVADRGEDIMDLRRAFLAALGINPEVKILVSKDEFARKVKAYKERDIREFFKTSDPKKREGLAELMESTYKAFYYWAKEIVELENLRPYIKPDTDMSTLDAMIKDRKAKIREVYLIGPDLLGFTGGDELVTQVPAQLATEGFLFEVKKAMNPSVRVISCTVNNRKRGEDRTHAVTLSSAPEAWDSLKQLSKIKDVTMVLRRESLGAETEGGFFLDIAHLDKLVSGINITTWWIRDEKALVELTSGISETSTQAKLFNQLSSLRASNKAVFVGDKKLVSVAIKELGKPLPSPFKRPSILARARASPALSQI